MVTVHTVCTFGDDKVQVHARDITFGVQWARDTELKLAEGEQFQVDWIRDAQNFSLCPLVAAPGYRTTVINDECGYVWVDNAKEVF